MRRILWIAMIFVVGCNGPTKSTVDDDPEEAMTMEEVEKDELSAGATESTPESLQGDELRTWLVDEARDLTLRLPVVVESSPLGVAGAWIYGARSTGDETPGLAVHLDDTRLGIGFAERLRSLCDHERCKVWIHARVAGEGSRGALALPGESTMDDRITLILVDLEGMVDDDEPTVSIVE